MIREGKEGAGHEDDMAVRTGSDSLQRAETTIFLKEDVGTPGFLRNA